MEIYILDVAFRRVNVVDTFESLIWTERFASSGDFEIVLHSTRENRKLFVSGVKLAINESYRVMSVETVEDTVDVEGRALLTVKGPSLEMILDDRVAADFFGDTFNNPAWILTGTPAAIARKIFNDICALGQLMPADIIPYLQPGTIFPASTIAESPDVITVELSLKTVYAAIKELCELYDMGFRLVRNFDMSQLYFDIYMGSDRTTRQSSLAAVVFSPELDNLQNTTELTTTELYKNAAYVFSPVGYALVYPEGIDPLIAGFERRILLVNADDITDPNPPTATALMTQRGLEELSKTRKLTAFDGEINQGISAYKYGVDYQLGDLVEMRNIDGVSNNMQVTEQIFVSDKEGERSYPTLVINTFYQQGTWAAWDINQVWIDLGTTTYWSTV